MACCSLSRSRHWPGECLPPRLAPRRAAWRWRLAWADCRTTAPCGVSRHRAPSPLPPPQYLEIFAKLKLMMNSVFQRSVEWRHEYWKLEEPHWVRQAAAWMSGRNCGWKAPWELACLAGDRGRAPGDQTDLAGLGTKADLIGCFCCLKDEVISGPGS